jgi:hypothetical protein
MKRASGICRGSCQQAPRGVLFGLPDLLEPGTHGITFPNAQNSAVNDGSPREATPAPPTLSAPQASRQATPQRSRQGIPSTSAIGSPEPPVASGPRHQSGCMEPNTEGAAALSRGSLVLSRYSHHRPL